MGELVDGRAMRASWVVPHSESEIGKKRSVLGPDRPEDHPEAPGWWGQVELGAVGQHGPVVAVLVHAPQVLDGHPVAFIVPSSDLGCLASSRRAASEIFLPGGLIEVRGKAAVAGSAQRPTARRRAGACEARAHARTRRTPRGSSLDRPSAPRWPPMRCRARASARRRPAGQSRRSGR